MRDRAAVERTRRGAASAGLIFVAGLIGVAGCASLSESPDAAAIDTEPAATAPAAPVRADPARVSVVHQLIRDALPRRIWWRYPPRESGDEFLFDPPRIKPEDVFVSDRPGGERLPGTWGCTYQCGEDTVPNSVACLEVLEAAIEDKGSTRGTWYGDYWHTWISAERAGTKWKLYTRLGSPPDPAFSEEERGLVGRWRHVEDGREIQLELLEGGSGRGSDGSDWRWISAEEGLELRAQEPHASYGLVWRTRAMRLAKDRRSYLGIHDEKTTGTRIDDGAKPR